MSASVPRYTRLKITGDISIETVTERVEEDAFVYLLMGPTGAGKSSFIQALSGDSQDLGIAGDQLAGFTQEASLYRLANVLMEYRDKTRPIYLVDTPGFSDPSISDLGVFNELSKCLPKIPGFHEYLFLTLVTDTRLPGSKRKTIEMLKEMHQPSRDCVAFTVVTTMWNTISNERSQQRAQSNFIHLRDEFSDTGSTTVRFTNTKDSALDVLDMGPWSLAGPGGNVVPYIYQDLYGRIKNALQRKRIVECDLTEPEAQTNPELRGILENSHKANKEVLKRFIGEFSKFRTLPEGLEDEHYGPY
ncbi:hypothetical protein BJ165DRAFT_1534382 [Panaeolus papilionaceus]|nr:hypothetical protein BJ165DRAFT_1534382 [Panaeolus papilionaceus]